MSDSGGNVDDATPFLGGAGTKGSLVGVLAVDGIRDDGVGGEGAVRIHVKHLGEVLNHCSMGLRQVIARIWNMGIPHLCRVDQLMRPGS